MVWYNQGKLVLADTTLENEAPVDYLTDTIKIALFLAAYTFDADHDHFDDLSNEIVATNYTSRGGADGTLAGKSVAIDAPNDRVEFNATDPVFTGIGNGANATIAEIVVLREPTTAPTDANSVLLAHDTVAPTLTNGGNITLVIDPEGLLQLT